MLTSSPRAPRSAAEIIKRRIPGLYQNNKITSISIQDTWEPLEEGLDSISVTRHVSVICITLSTQPLSTTVPGYQPPLPPEMVKIHKVPLQQHLPPHSLLQVLSSSWPCMHSTIPPVLTLVRTHLVIQKHQRSYGMFFHALPQTHRSRCRPCYRQGALLLQMHMSAA